MIPQQLNFVETSEDMVPQQLLVETGAEETLSAQELELAALCDEEQEHQQQSKEEKSSFPQQESKEDSKEEEQAEKTYSRADLESWDLLDQPTWVFDIVTRSMWFANTAAVQLWSAPDLPSLLARDFKADMSTATAQRLDNYLQQFNADPQGARVREQWTFYPNNGANGPQTVVLSSRGICIEEGRMAMLCQGAYMEAQNSEAEQEALRSVEMLRHLPVAVCLTDLDGHVIEQNPEALAIYGNTSTKSKMKDTSSRGGSSSGEGKTPEDDEDDDEEDEDDADDSEDEDCQEEEKDQFDGLDKATLKQRKTWKKSTFIRRFVDKELGYRILAQARQGTDVISLEAMQHTVLGPRWSAVQVRQTKDPVTSEPILLYSARDITAVVEAKRQAVAADVAKMDLLTDMAHAIRTPLQHVVGVAELISKQQQQRQDIMNLHDSNSSPKGPMEEISSHLLQSEDARFSNLLQSAAQLLMNVIHDLMESVGSGTGSAAANRNNNNMDRSRSSAKNGGVDRAPSAPGRSVCSGDDGEMSPPTRRNNRILLEHAPFDVRAIVENTVASITPQAKTKNLSVQVRINKFSRNSTAFNVMGDSNRLGQILFELLHK